MVRRHWFYTDNNALLPHICAAKKGAVVWELEKGFFFSFPYLLRSTLHILYGIFRDKFFKCMSDFACTYLLYMRVLTLAFLYS